MNSHTRILRRVADANPFPVPRALEPDESLLARIFETPVGSATPGDDMLDAELRAVNMRPKPFGRRTLGLAMLVAVAIAAVGAAFVLAGSTNADKGLRARDVLSVFSATTPTTTPPADLTKVRSFSIVDFTQTRELGRHLGQYDSSLFVAPGREGRSVCYMLYPSPGSMGIGEGYCHPLGDIPQTAKDHYSAMAPWSRVEGEYHTQVFGIVFDDVVEVRVRVDGTWRRVPILKGNGFYLDLPGTRADRFEVTLADGTVQGHDIAP